MRDRIAVGAGAAAEAVSRNPRSERMIRRSKWRESREDDRVRQTRDTDAGTVGQQGDSLWYRTMPVDDDDVVVPQSRTLVETRSMGARKISVRFSGTNQLLQPWVVFFAFPLFALNKNRSRVIASRASATILVVLRGRSDSRAWRGTKNWVAATVRTKPSWRWDGEEGGREHPSGPQRPSVCLCVCLGGEDEAAAIGFGRWWCWCARIKLKDRRMG
jgi:hypothetical protein